MAKFNKIIAVTLGVLLLVGCNNATSSTKGNNNSTNSSSSKVDTSTPAPSVSSNSSSVGTSTSTDKVSSTTSSISTPKDSTSISTSSPVEKPDVTGYALYVNDVKLTDLVENPDASLQPGQLAEYMATATLNVGDVLTILDSNGDAEMHWESGTGLIDSEALTAQVAGDYTFYFKTWNDGGTSVWVTMPETSDTPIIPDVPVGDTYGLYVNGSLVADFAINSAATLLPGQSAEYMTSADLVTGDVVTIKGPEGTTIDGLWWENTNSNNDYVAAGDGTYTFYFKVYDDGGRTVWVTVPAGVDDPVVNPGDITVTQYGLYVNGTLFAAFAYNAGATGGADEEHMVEVSLNEGDVVSIHDKDGNVVSNIYWENPKVTSDTYTAAVTGTYTFYFKLYSDGGKTVWVAAPAAPVDPNAETITVYYTNPNGWTNVHAYAWNGCDLGSWPGTLMQYDATTGYYYIEGVVPGSNIIFNNGNGGTGNQTADLDVPTDGSNLFNGISWSVYTA